MYRQPIFLLVVLILKTKFWYKELKVFIILMIIVTSNIFRLQHVMWIKRRKRTTTPWNLYSNVAECEGGLSKIRNISSLNQKKEEALRNGLWIICERYLQPSRLFKRLPTDFRPGFRKHFGKARTIFPYLKVLVDGSLFAWTFPNVTFPE